MAMTGRELAKEIQSQNKGYRAGWMGEQEWKDLVYGKGINSRQEYEKYCEDMSGDVKTYHISEIKN